MPFKTVIIVFLVLVGLAIAAGRPTAAQLDPTLPSPNGKLTGPMSDVDEIVFAVRLGYDDPHWYANIGYFCDDHHRKAYAGNGKPDVGRLCKLNIRSGEVTALVDDLGGSIRDPHVHYDAQRILFSYRRSETDYYNLYEIGVDGTGLRQITEGPFDDYEPTYLPDGDIVFVSTRCQCWVSCWKTQVGVLYRCDGDGQNIQRLSHNIEHDNTPSVLPDGRLLYTRWEYVDRSQVEFHHLWTMNPDGTGQMVYYGNMRPGIVMIDAQPIPGSDKVLASFSPGHGVTDHRGIATVISPSGGPDEQSTARRLHKRPLVKDPYPVSVDCFLAARGKQILAMDGTGATQTLLTLPGEGEIHEPRPIVPRKRERVIPSHTDPSRKTGELILADVYAGRNMEGVQRGDIQKLLVLEALPKPVNFSGGPDLVSWLGTFNLERVLGTVPVEEDGSAYFEVPAGRGVFFVALDDADMSVKRMHSFTSVMPGEATGCVGCHERRSEIADTSRTHGLQAMCRPPSRIQPFDGLPDVLDFPRDIQPVLDRHCVRCHNYRQRDGDAVLTGDLGPTWSHSFFSLFAHRQIADGRNGLGNQPPRSIGSAASALMCKLDGSHYDVQVSPREWRTVWLWIESGAPYAGTYAALRNERAQQISFTTAARVFVDRSKVLRRRCGSCHVTGDPRSETGMPLPFQPATRRNRLARPTGIHERVVLDDDPLARFSVNILLNFTRPRCSPLLLGPLAKEAGGYGSCGPVFKGTDDPDYQLLLSSIQHAKSKRDEVPQFATPTFRPNEQYIREMIKYRILRPNFDATRDSIDVYRVDQSYWQAAWY